MIKNLGIETGDILLSVNGKNYNYDNINDLIMWSTALKENEEVSFTIRRNGVAKKYSGKAILPKEMIPGYQFTDTTKLALKEAWLKE